MVEVGVADAHDASADGNGLSGEGDLEFLVAEETEFLFDFDHVLVSAEAVGIHVVVAVGIVKAGAWFFAGTGDACFTVAYDAGEINDAGLNSGGEGEDAADGEATGIADELLIGGEGMQFGKTVLGGGEKFRRVVCGVLSEKVGIVSIAFRGVEAEVTAVVDDFGSFFYFSGGGLHTDAVGGGEDNQVVGLVGSGIFGGQDGLVAEAAEVGKDITHAASGIGETYEGGDVDMRVLEEEFGDADSAISACAYDLCLYHAVSPAW